MTQSNIAINASRTYHRGGLNDLIELNFCLISFLDSRIFFAGGVVVGLLSSAAFAILIYCKYYIYEHVPDALFALRLNL